MRTDHRFGVAPLCAAISLVSTAGAAEQVRGDNQQAPLATVIVTAVAPLSPLTFVTDTKLPRQPVPASDGADYLKTIPGFSVVRNGGTNGDPVLRGMFGSRLNILTNDGQMPGACPSRMDNPLSYVSPETYDQLVVIKGPQTVLWGPGASAGTIRFERDPQASRFDAPGMRVDANTLTGSFGRNDQVLDVVGGTGAGYARVSANRSEADDYADGDGRVVPSRWEKWNADAALGWTPAEGSLLEISAGTGDAEARYAGRGMDGSQFERTSYGLRFEQTGLTGVLEEVTANVFYNYANHVMDNYTLREPNPTSSMPIPMATNVDRRTVGGRIATLWTLERIELTVGLDTSDSRHRTRSAMGRHAYAQQRWQTDAVLSNTGAFAEAVWHVHDGGHAVFGARADRAAATDQRVLAGRMMPMPNPTAGETRRETLRSGFVRYERDASKNPTAWFAGVGHTERMPDYWELFSPNMGPAGSINAFSALHPERTTQLDIGLQYRTERVSAWASAYAGTVSDFILFTYSSGGMMGSTTSVAQVDADIYGGEAGVELRLPSQWKFAATLAYSAAERESGEPLPQIPPLDARFTLAYAAARWTAGALLRVVDGQDRIAPDQGTVVGRDLGPTSAFAVVSLNGAYRFSPQLSLAAGIDNLFDRTYTEHLNLAGSADFGFPADPVRINEPGRTAWLKLVWSVNSK
jgi:iron complex outermembrane receptor protein